MINYVRADILKAALRQHGDATAIRDLEKRHGLPIGVFADLSGGDSVPRSIRAKMCEALGVEEKKLFAFHEDEPRHQMVRGK